MKIFIKPKVRRKVCTYTLSHDCHLLLSGCCFRVHGSLLSHFSSLYSLCFLNFLFQNSSSSLLQSPMKSIENKSIYSELPLKVWTIIIYLSDLITHLSFRPNYACLTACMPTILILLHKRTVLSDDNDSKSLVRFLLLQRAQKITATS